MLSLKNSFYSHFGFIPLQVGILLLLLFRNRGVLLNQTKLWLQVRDSFWFLPVIYSICSFVAVGVTTAIDVWLIAKIADSIPNVLLTNKGIAKSLYSSLITAILTMTTISFSTIMVVLTTYSSQFSPRTLQDFMRSKVTQHVLGVFSFGFVYVLMNLWLLGESKEKALLSPLFTVIVAIICLAFFILFIHHSSRWVQVNFLIGTIRNEASKVIKRTFEEKNYGGHQDWEHSEIDRLETKDKKTIFAKRSGYIQKIEYGYLIQWARQNNLILEANFQIGGYVPKGMPVFYFWSFGEKDYEEQDHDQFIIIGDERTDIQDIEFSLQKLVEIAVKAISPSLNDPHTAINCVNRIGALLTELSENYRPITYYSDDNGELRLIMEQNTFKDYLYKCFYQIRHYGKNDISVMYSITEVLYKTAVVSKESIQKEIWEFNKYILEAIDVENLASLDYQHLKNITEKFARLIDEELPWK